MKLAREICFRSENENEWLQSQHAVKAGDVALVLKPVRSGFEKYTENGLGKHTVSNPPRAIWEIH